MKKKLLILAILPFLLAGCPKNGGGSGGGSNIPDKPAETETDGDKYDAWLNTWSKPGHMYIHYNRGNKGGYDDYCLWLWPFMPKSLEGTLWAYNGKTKVSDTLTLKPMSNSWMTFEDVKRSDGSGVFLDNYGVIADVDYSSNNLVGGKTGKSVSFSDAEWIGFLFPQVSHMDGSTMWVSDGGRENYIEDIQNDEYWRDIDNENGKGKAIHIFLSSGSLDQPTFFAGSGVPDVKINPIDEDTTGNYSSKTEEYNTNAPKMATSSTFKDLGVGYQVFVASFRDSNGDGMGDIRGVIDSLDYLSDLGVQALWLTPIQKSDSYHGYDISDYYAVDPRFGTISDYRELIYKAHEKGMKVLMDLVLNHTSKGNVWFTKSQWGEKSKGPNGQDIDWRNMYTWKFETDMIEKYINGSYQKISVKEDANSKNPSWYRDGESHYYYYGKFGSGMPEINYQNPQTRELVIDMAKYWMSFGLDGYRLDAVKHIFMRDEAYSAGDTIIEDYGSKRAYDDEKGEYVTKDFDYSSNITKNVKWWKEFAQGIKKDYPNCFLVGENFDGWGTRTAPYYEGLDSQFNFGNYYHIPATFLTLYPGPSGGASAWKSSHVAENMDEFVKYRNDAIDGAFTSNHDVMRAINQANGPVTKDEPRETTAVAQITGAGHQVDKAKIQAAVTILSQGLSWIYYGDELGMSSNTNKHIELYGNENSEDIWYRQPFLWQDTTVRANYQSGQYVFELDDYNKTLPSMEEQKVDPNSMYSWYKAMIDIKKMYPANAKVTVSSNCGMNVMVLKVTGNGKSMAIWISAGVTLPDKPNNDLTFDYSVNIPGELGTDQYEIVKQIGPAPVDGYNIGKAPYSVLAVRAK